MEDHLYVCDDGRCDVKEPAASYGGVVLAERRGFRVAPVDQLIRREVGIERYIEQAALSPRIDVGKPGGCRHLLAVGAEHAQPTGTLRHEHLAVWQKREAPRVGEVVG